MGLSSSKVMADTLHGKDCKGSRPTILPSVHDESPNNGPTPEVPRRQLPLVWDPRSPTQEIVRTPIQVEKTPQREIKKPHKFEFTTSEEVTKELELVASLDTSLEGEEATVENTTANGATVTQIEATDEADTTSLESYVYGFGGVTQYMKKLSIVEDNNQATKALAPVSLKKRILMKNSAFSEVNRSPLMQINGCTPRKNLQFLPKECKRREYKENVVVWND